METMNKTIRQIINEYSHPDHEFYIVNHNQETVTLHPFPEEMMDIELTIKRWDKDGFTWFISNEFFINSVNKPECYGDKVQYFKDNINVKIRRNKIKLKYYAYVGNDI